MDEAALEASQAAANSEQTEEMKSCQANAEVDFNAYNNMNMNPNFDAHAR